MPPIGWPAVHVQRDEQINIDENETIEDHIVKLRSSQTILWMILWWIEWRTLMAMRGFWKDLLEFKLINRLFNHHFMYGQS